ncbi:hypothetical protein HN51_022368 [Arachis hypogaea]|uniref:F-box/FBD/LRR-repeat protein At2g04230-like n=1 Tax=Arachis duranensis TaxID=130453 RepID=A0A6P5N5B2_ARADU|nr:F-box/FBD/LRR-repeat protein At2g04230-like [Arachis duranensis]XP_020991168.1 F-box/FBD/LRR-repeat protein At2g04230-like [Arachis duranensis]XP_020991170.1 F-box/FBD/LRR-repeat protein At2g04230-like [Arachis duranensis]XP_025650752.1 F-box/FBD/LRR-repeat protein At2g04230 [Arachis hypogaea]XP_025650753.1 F-box/FBD/LRR-repeat protein At2g04230 [Arachis hypogaea]XP_025650754.1 F-box/FBD/LRR-repeat protein At2g04230 [Arachis hypogaea]XP_029148179.1 F-box/FBD/LRR-repeat protein At2g04230 [A
MDRLSGLPKTILHDILAKLPNEDAVKTSVLSKAWRETWSTFPRLHICSSYFINVHDLSTANSVWHCSKDILADYVMKRLLRFHEQGLIIKEFRLCMDYIGDFNYMSCHLDIWMKMICECGIKGLELHFPADGDFFPTSEYCPDKWYNLPLCVTEAKSLTELNLKGPIRICRALFLNHSSTIKLNSLRMLCLCSVLFEDEGVIKHLLSSCPLIEHFAMEDCCVYNPLSRENPLLSSPVKSLSLRGLQKLKRVYVSGIQEVYIDAPNLKSFYYVHCDFDDMDVPWKLNLDSCINLRWLRLCSMKNTAIAHKWFLELFDKFPYLETLQIHRCSMSERINISSSQLKFLDFLWCSNLKELNIDAPNLLSCDFRGNDTPVITFLSSSNKLKVNVFTDMDFQHYNLREFIQNIKPHQVLTSLSLFVDFPLDIELGVLQSVSSTPPHIRHLEFRRAPNREALYFPYLNWLLSSCCPETISFLWQSSSYYIDIRPFIVFIYEMLMGRIGCCRSDHGNKCWWYALKNVKVTCSFITGDIVNIKTMLDAWPDSDAEENVRFILEL